MLLRPNHPYSPSPSPRQIRRRDVGAPLVLDLSTLSLNDADVVEETPAIHEETGTDDENEGLNLGYSGVAGGGTVDGGACSSLRHHISLILVIISAFMFSISSLLVKLTMVGTFQIMLIRCIFMLLYVAIVQIRERVWPFGNWKLFKYLFCRGFFGVTNKLAVYYAILNMPLADAIVISFTAPAWTILLSVCLIRERPGIMDVIVCLTMLTGAVLVAQPEFIFADAEAMTEKYPNHRIASLAGLTSAVCTALALISLRKVSAHVHYTVPVLYFCVIGIIEPMIVLSLPFMENFEPVHCGTERYFIILFSVLGLAGQTLVTFAARREKAYMIAVGRSSEIIFTLLIQIVFLQEASSLLSLVGAGIIFCSIISIAFKKHLAATDRLCCELC